MTNTSYERGDVVLVPFPLTDANPTRRRPAVVVSSARYNASTGEVVLLPLTGRSRLAPRMGDYAVLDWQQAGLVGPATARVRPVTLRAARVQRRLGALSRRDLDALALWLRRVLEL